MQDAEDAPLIYRAYTGHQTLSVLHGTTMLAKKMFEWVLLLL